MQSATSNRGQEMDRRNFIKASTLAGVSLNALPIIGTIRAGEQPAAEPGIWPGSDSPSQSAGPSSLKNSRVLSYVYPRILPVSPIFRVIADGHDITAVKTSVGPFAAFACEGPVEVSIEVPGPVGHVRIAPARCNIKAKLDRNRVSFMLPQPMNLLIEIDGLEQLFLFANPIEASPVAPVDSNVRYFQAGQVYEVGELRLHDNETLYIEGGAVVRGCIRATSANNVRICGQGVLDGSYYRQGVDGRRSIVLENCRNSRVEGIVMIEPSSWMLVLGASRNIVVSNVKELGFISGGDGLDIVGSSQIRVEDCFFRNGDDCVVLKSLDLRGNNQDAKLDFTYDVEDIEVTGCSLMTDLGGQIFEIGHELRSANVRNIHFHDCDVLEVREYGAPFGIHNSDHAIVSEVLYEDIRVEHHYNKLIEFRIFESRWSKDKQRGQVCNITLRNIDVTVSEFNPGYTVSVIGGCDAGHTVDHVAFENFRMNGKTAASGDDIYLFTNGHASNITFR
jgi:hypothetical protein